MAGIKKSPSALAGGKGDPTLRQAYAKAHRFGLKIAKFHDVSNEKHIRIASDLHECRTWFEYDHYVSEGKNKITKGYSCKHYSLCPSCAMARARKVFHQTKEKLLALDLPVQQVKLLTITVKNTENFTAGLKNIRKFYASLVQSRKNASRRDFSIQNSPFVSVDGWIGRYEVTRNKKDLSWHPHLHLLIAVNPEHTELFKRKKHDYKYGEVEGFFKNEFSKLLADRLWKNTGDSFMVDCRDLKESDFEEKKLGSVAEVSKYLFKFGELQGEEYWNVYDSTRGMRLGVCGGVFRGISLEPDTLNEDEPKGIENELPRIRYEMKWRDSHSGYRRTIVETANLPEFTDEDWKQYECDSERDSRIARDIEKYRSGGYAVVKSYSPNGDFSIGGWKTEGTPMDFKSGVEFAVALRDDPFYFEEYGHPRFYRYEFLDFELSFGRNSKGFFCSVDLSPEPDFGGW